MEKTDYSQKKNQIGCGYCANEEGCKKRDPKINKAKSGCKDWQHWQDKNFEQEVSESSPSDDEIKLTDNGFCTLEEAIKKANTPLKPHLLNPKN